MNEKNDDDEMDMVCDHEKENAERMRENEKKKSRSNQ